MCIYIFFISKNNYLNYLNEFRSRKGQFRKQHEFLFRRTKINVKRRQTSPRRRFRANARSKTSSKLRKSKYFFTIIF